MTGNSDNDLGNPGDPSVPADVPSGEGEPLYRPLRGWASAYQPEPSFWSKLGSLFSRKKQVEPDVQPEPDVQREQEQLEPIEAAESPEEELEFVAEAAQSAEAFEEPSPLAEEGLLPADEVADEEIPEEYHEAFDTAFDAPRSTLELGRPSPGEIEDVAPIAYEPPAVDSNPRFSDPAFFVPGEVAPDEASLGEPRAAPELSPPVRDYQLSTGEDIADLPVVRDYELHEADEPLPEPQFIPARSLLDDEPEVKKPGFFARLFGFGRTKAPAPIVSEPSFTEAVGDETFPAADEFEPVASSPADVAPAEETSERFEDADAEVDAFDAAETEAFATAADEPLDAPEIEPPVVDATPEVSAPRLDRPSMEFFMRVDRAADGDAPSLDEALPMGEADLVEAASDTGQASQGPNPYTEVPTDPWIPAVPEPFAPKLGFLRRLFGRKSKPLPLPEVQPELAPDDSAEVFAAFDEPQGQPAGITEFASVDDALPAEDVTSDESFATPVADEWSRFAPPPSSPEPPAADSRSTLELEEVDDHAPEPTGARSTLEMEEVADPLASTWDGNMVDLDATMQEPAAESDARSTVQVPPIVVEDVTTGEMVPPTPPEVTEAMEAERPPFFVPKFRAFYNEIVSHKLQKAEFTAGFATAVMDYTADLSPDAAAQQVQKRLGEILELQAAEATWMGGEAAARYPDAQYAMAALADEVFTNIDWAGRDAWPRYMIEQRLFKSNAKDVEFFKRVDKLLKNESEKPSAAAKDLARMYLLVLAAGFEGKYRPFGLTRPLAEYRRRLYEFVSGRDPLMIYAEERKLFPEAADRVVVGRAVSRFSMLQQWAAVLVILLIGYAVISQVAWNRVSADLKDVTARVEAANSSATSDGVAGDPR